MIKKLNFRFSCSSSANKRAINSSLGNLRKSRHHQILTVSMLQIHLMSPKLAYAQIFFLIQFILGKNVNILDICPDKGTVMVNVLKF